MANSLQVCLQILLQNTTDLIEGFGFDIKKDNQIELSIAKCQIQFRIITSLAKKKIFCSRKCQIEIKFTIFLQWEYKHKIDELFWF